MGLKRERYDRFLLSDLCNTRTRFNSFMRGFCQGDNITNFTARPQRPQRGVYVSDLCGLCDLVVKFSLRLCDLLLSSVFGRLGPWRLLCEISLFIRVYSRAFAVLFCVLCAHARNASRSDAGGSFAAIPL